VKISSKIWISPGGNRETAKARRRTPVFKQVPAWVGKKIKLHSYLYNKNGKLKGIFSTESSSLGLVNLVLDNISQGSSKCKLARPRLTMTGLGSGAWHGTDERETLSSGRCGMLPAGGANGVSLIGSSVC
jgi:hypothetical protein